VAVGTGATGTTTMKKMTMKMRMTRKTTSL